VLKRLWFLLAGIWALCCLIPDADRITGKLLGKAFAPFALGWFVERAGRFVVTGSPLKAREARAVPPPLG
jgi:hypothetical protein